MIILVKGDSHINLKSLEEQKEIFAEIMGYDADLFVDLGDFFDKKKPDPDEHFFGTMIAYQLVKKYKKVVVLRGNHPKIRNEFTAIDYLQWMGVQVEETYEVVDNLKTYFFGHFFTDRSVHYKDKNVTLLSDIKADVIVLGHEHSPTVLSKPEEPFFALHLGSSIYESFAEVDNPSKYLLRIDTTKQTWEKIPLKSPVPMKDVHSLSELTNVPAKTKVRWVVTDWLTYKSEINQVKDWANKFVEFQVHYAFPVNVETPKEESQVKSKLDIKELVSQFLNNLDDEDVKNILTAEFKKEGGLCS